MSVESFKHAGGRPHVPSAEEAGAETASPVVRERPDHAAYPANPVVHRGQDPELFWMHKYGPADDGDGRVHVDVRSLYRSEHVDPHTLIDALYKRIDSPPPQGDLFGQPDDFEDMRAGDAFTTEYYEHADRWRNRLIQGDSLLVMTSLLEREGMAGQVQMIYIDPPYGIKYGSNWQIRLNDRTVKDGDDAHLSGEGEVIRAYRDTWELGIHSYLTYLRDRLVVARELLHESGSCFVQISDENVHLVRCLMDEVFGSGNYCSQIAFRKTTGKASGLLDNTYDVLLWYAKSREEVKYRTLYFQRRSSADANYRMVELPDGTRRSLSKAEAREVDSLPAGWRVFRANPLTSQSASTTTLFEYEFEGKTFRPGKGGWKTNLEGMRRLEQARRLMAVGNTLAFVRYFDDFPYQAYNDIWDDTRQSGFGDAKRYTVQTATTVIERCLQMTTDPGDLALDPTCGSGTTAAVAEQWGRRWITIDSSRIALNVAKARLMTATYPYYTLHDPERKDLRQGFNYARVPHVMLQHISRAEPAEQETLYDQPADEKGTLRVAGPFTVETLQSFEPVPPAELAAEESPDDAADFEQRVFDGLKSAGVRNGRSDEHAVFTRVDRLPDAYLHAEGFFPGDGTERKAYIHVGPRFGTVTRQAVSEAIKACRQRMDADWLVILGFAFESGLSDVTRDFGTFEVSLVRMNDDLMQQGLLKKDRKAASFVTIGEPDIRLHRDGDTCTVEVAGLDLYDPIRDEVKPRSIEDIAYWMVDDDYDGFAFVVRQAFFSGGDRDEFAKWRKGLDDLAGAKARQKRNVERTLKIEIDEEAFDRLYGFVSRPIPATAGRRVAVRVVSQVGEESTKVLEV